MLTVLVVLGVISLGTSIGVAMGKCPPYVPLITLSIAELLRSLPLGK